MKLILVLIAIFSFLGSTFIFGMAESVFHEIAALLTILIGIVCFCSACIINAIENN